MLAPGPVPAADPSFAALKDAIITRTGHHYYVDKDYLLRDRLGRRLAATGCSTLNDYLVLLAQPKRGDAEWQELEAEITIGETFFFRHQEQFTALRDVIFPDLIRANANRRSLRIWSAGCAVGAEPYSIAILLERLLGPALRDWTIDILGSDISARALDQARTGVFSDWALRGMPPAERARDFTPTPDRRHWRIADRHRLRLRFAQHNLLSLPPEGDSAGWANFDLILCRNVMIYFSPARIAPTLSALSRCLSPTGWLMVGHSDAIAALPRHLHVVELAGTMAFRRSDLPEGNETAVLTRQPKPPPAPEPVTATRQTAIPPRRNMPLSSPEPAAVRAEPCRQAVPSLAVIRALADGGRLAEAASACRLAIEAEPLDARLHLYDGIIAQAGGHRAEAEAALRRAVYLAGDMVLAHYHLGLLLLDGPAPEAGRRSMAQVIQLCDNLPQDVVLPESDELTPRDLAERVRLRLRARRI